MTALSLPDVTTLDSLDAEGRAGVLDLLFEPCTQLHTLAVSTLSEKSFSSYAKVIQSVHSQLDELFNSNLESDQKWLEAILSAHPRLGQKKVESEMSKREQAGLQASGKEADEECERLVDLNQKYEEKFPGLIYVTFVNGRPRSTIMEDMQRRIESSTIQKEKQDAIEAMCDIALSRAHKLGAE